jgi:hypothetical protein
MQIIYELILEAIAAVFGWLVYGTEKHPRHPAIRNSVRIIAFSGSIFAFGWLMIPNTFGIPWLALLVWCSCGIAILFAEAELGQARIAIAGWVCAAVLLAVVIAKHM